MSDVSEGKLIATAILNTSRQAYERGFAEGRRDTLEEAARIILATAKGQHRHVAAYLADALVAAIKLPPNSDLPKSPESQ